MRARLKGVDDNLGPASTAVPNSSAKRIKHAGENAEQSTRLAVSPTSFPKISGMTRPTEEPRSFGMDTEQNGALQVRNTMEDAERAFPDLS